MTAKLNEKQIEEVLTRQLIGRIGCHADGVTYVVPISYAYDGESVYAHTFEGMKTRIMRKNPNVCFEVDNTKDTANWQSVIAWGEYEELIDAEERHKAVKILSNRILPLNSSVTTHLGTNWPFADDDDLGNIEGVVFRIRLTEKTGRFEFNEETPSYTL